MDKVVLSGKQTTSLMTLFLIGDSLIFGMSSSAKKNFWIAILLAGIMAIPLILIFVSLCKKFPNKNLLEINETLFGKYLGKFFNLLFLVFVIYNVVSVLRSFGEFIVTVSFPETPMIIPIIFIAMLGIWSVKEGIEVLGSYSRFFLIFLLVLISLACFFLIPNMNVNNIRPIFSIELRPLMEGVLSTFTFPFGEIVTLFLVFRFSNIRDFSVNIFLRGLFISISIILLTSLTEVLVLGVNSYTSVYFPSYEAVSRISIGGFLKSLEIIVAISFISTAFLKVAFSLYVIAESIISMLNFENYRFFVTPITFNIINLTLVMYKDLMHLFQWAEKFWSFFALPFQLFLPIVIFIVANFRKKVKESLS